MHKPKIGIVIPTLGINDCLAATLASISHQTMPASCVVVVDQSSDQRIKDICEDASQTLPVIHLRTHKGASHARNIGIKHLPTDIHVVGFLDDDCTYENNCLEQAGQYLNLDKVGAISGRLESEQTRLLFGDQDELLNRRTVWTKAIEATTFCKMAAIQKAGNFDENLGIGGPTPWQSGEGTDLLLRIMNHGYVVWYTPSCIVREHEQQKISPAPMARKSRIYARGTGRVYRAHYPLVICLWQVLRPVLGAIVSRATGHRETSILRFQAAIGRWEGITSRLID